METLLLKLATRLWPDLKGMSEPNRLVGVGDVTAFLIMLPLALAGLAWLGLETDPGVVRHEWEFIALLAILLIIFNRVSYFLIVEIRPDRYGSADGSLASMVLWSGVFLIGPAVLWISILLSGVRSGWNLLQARSQAQRWSIGRGLAHEWAGDSLAYLVALAAYREWGGVFPLSGLNLQTIVPAIGALIVQFGIVLLLWSGYFAYGIWVQVVLARSAALEPLLKFILMAMGLPFLAQPFAILAAGLYVQDGVMVYLFFVGGLLLVALLARRLSWAAESSRQQSRQLQMLEQLGRAIINSPPDGSALPKVLEQHVPAMFPSARILIWVEMGQLLFKNPADWGVEIAPIWEAVQGQRQPQAFLTSDRLPWQAQHTNHDPAILAPILDSQNDRTIGSVFVELRSLAQPWDARALKSLFPAVQSLSAQVASALNQVRIYQETLAYQQAMQELAFAGQIQASLLPNEMPKLDGWELAVTYLPARETSGDYFDIIPLEDGKVGILIADVTDKGLGAALYMALSRTLIRTYALEYVDSQPDLVFFSTNERILSDARANLFVTAFYGVLDQPRGQLVYCNAGHSPPLLFSRSQNAIRELNPTGIPIGIDQDAVWKQATVEIEPGEVLLLYTDGIPDAKNQVDEFFGQARLVEVVKANSSLSAAELQVAILHEIQNFVGDAAQFDDITLLVLSRDAISDA